MNEGSSIYLNHFLHSPVGAAMAQKPVRKPAAA
jgi:hypothetical protein